MFNMFQGPTPATEHDDDAAANTLNEAPPVTEQAAADATEQAAPTEPEQSAPATTKHAAPAATTSTPPTSPEPEDYPSIPDLDDGAQTVDDVAAAGTPVPSQQSVADGRDVESDQQPAPASPAAPAPAPTVPIPRPLPLTVPMPTFLLPKRMPTTSSANPASDDGTADEDLEALEAWEEQLAIQHCSGQVAQPLPPAATPSKPSPWIKLNHAVEGDTSAPPTLPPPASDVPSKPPPRQEQKTVQLSELLMSASRSMSQPYKVQALLAPEGGSTAVESFAEIDDGAMQVVLGASFYEANVHVFGALQATNSHAQMADGRLRPFDGKIKLDINVQGVRVQVEAVVLKVHYDMLLGKPWCHLARAIHIYELDWFYLLDASIPKGWAFIPNLDSDIGCTGVTMSPDEAIAMLIREGKANLQVGKSTRLTPEQLRLITMGPQEAQQWEDVAAIDEYARQADADEYLTVSPVRRTDCTAPSFNQVTVDEHQLPPVRAQRRNEWQPYHLFGTPQPTDERISAILRSITFGDDLSSEQREQLEDLVRRHHAVFGMSAADLASNRKIVFDIELEQGATCPSFNVRDPRLTPDDKEWLWDYCQKLLNVGILRKVQPEDVKWLSDIKIVPKDKGHWACSTIDAARELANDGLRRAHLPFDPSLPTPAPVAPSQWEGPSGRRLVHNYIPLNRRTKNVVPYPVGAMEQKVTSLAGKRYYSSFDMLLGYFAIEASARAQDYLTFFVEGIGHLTYTRMPFGPVEGPARFNVLGNAAFGHLEQPNAASADGSFVRWMDDLIVGSTAWDGHLRFLEALLELCADCGITLSAKKTALGTSQVRWCGNVISAAGVSSDPAKVAAIVRWGPLKCPMDVLRFVNTASFLRSRIPDFAALAAPLIALCSLVDVPDGVGRRRGTRRQALLKTPMAWRWAEEEEKSVALVKAAAAFAIAATPPDFSKFWFVDVDASPGAFGAALLQPGEGHERRLVAVASKKCSPAEGKASQFLREFMAIRFALDRFDQYVKGGRIIVTTDCIGLQDLLNSTDLTSTYVRWRESLLNYNIVRFVHRPGKGNLLCDGLSRKLEHDDVAEIAQTWEERAGLADSDGSWSEPLPTGLVTTSPEGLAQPSAQLAVNFLLSLKHNNIDQGRAHPSTAALAPPAVDVAAAPVAKAPAAVDDAASSTAEAPIASRISKINIVPSPATIADPPTDNAVPTTSAVRKIAHATDGERLLAQFKDDPALPIVQWLLLGELDEQVARRGVTRRLAHSYFLEGGQVYYWSRTSGRVLTLVTVAEGIRMALQYHQTEGHYGRDQVALRARKDGWYWVDMKGSIEQALATGPTCQACAPRQSAVLTGPVIHPQPFDLLALDFLKLPLGPGARDELAYVCVLVDYFSRFVWALRVPQTAAGAAHALRHIALTVATPKRVLTDNGSHFTGKAFEEACASLGVAHTTSPVYAPWSNGVVERNNGELVTQLRKLCAETRNNYWPDLLEPALSNINRRIISSLGFSPQELLYGTISWGTSSAAAAGLLPLEPEELLPQETVEVRQTLLELMRDGVTQQRIDSIPEQSNSEGTARFAVGDLVMQYRHNPGGKLQPRWAGPFRVTHSWPKSVQLETLDGLQLKYRHHHAHLRPFYTAGS